MAGFLGKLFDFNHDGKLDAFERAAEADFLDTMQDDDDHEGMSADDGDDFDDFGF